MQFNQKGGKDREKKQSDLDVGIEYLDEGIKH